MGIINSDFIISGKHGQILSDLYQNKLYSSNAEGFVEAFFLGIYYGKKSEVDEGKGKVASISRTFFQTRSDLERIMFTYLQLEKAYQQVPLDIKEVYLINDEIPEEQQKLMKEEIKAYAFYGLEVLAERHQDVLGYVNELAAIDSVTEQKLLSESELIRKVQEDEKNVFHKSFVDEEIDSILMN